MNPDEFIRKNIIKKLIELGYQDGVALELAADEGDLILDGAHKLVVVEQYLMIVIT